MPSKALANIFTLRWCLNEGHENGTLVACLAVKFARPGTSLFSRDPAQIWAADTACLEWIAAVSFCCDHSRHFNRSNYPRRRLRLRLQGTLQARPESIHVVCILGTQMDLTQVPLASK